MVKTITRRKFLEYLGLIVVVPSGIVCTIGSGGNGDPEPEPEPEPDYQSPSISRFLINGSEEPVELGANDNTVEYGVEDNEGAAGTVTPYTYLISVLSRQSVPTGITAALKSGQIDLGDITGLMTIEALVKDPEDGEASVRRNISRISHANFDKEEDNPIYDITDAAVAREIIGDWSLVKEYGTKIIDGTALDEILRIEEVSGESIFGDNTVVGTVNKRFLVPKAGDMLYDELMYELTGFNAKSIGFTNDNKYAAAELTATTYQSIDELTTSLTGVDNIISVVKDTEPEGVDSSGAGSAHFSYNGGVIELDCDERMMYEKADREIWLAVVHNPTEQESSDIQKINEAYNDAGIGVTPVYNDASRLGVFTKMDKAYKALEKGELIPLSEPDPIQTSSLSKLVLPAAAIVVGAGYNKFNEMNNPKD